jgi:predicted RNase H-like HicB family nuclease
MRYAIVIEKVDGNYSAYVPDLPGHVATGATGAEVEAEIREAIAFPVEGLREDGLPIPPTSRRRAKSGPSDMDAKWIGLHHETRSATDETTYWTTRAKA